jgi:hypothetical protein
MAILSFTSPTIWVGLSDLSANATEVALDFTAADLNSTNFASGGWETHLAGLRSAKANVKGLWDAGTANLPDDLLFGEVGVGGVPMTVAPLGATVANVCYMGTFLRPTYKTGGKVGELLQFDSPSVADSPLVRGQIASVVAKTVTGTTASLNLGAVGATQRIYAAIHVLTATGTTPSLTVTVQSDTATGFPAPTTVVTGAAILVPGFQWLTGPVGASANTWQRLSLTISGTTPSFLLYAAIGIA